MRYDLVFNSLSVDVQKLLDCRLIVGDNNVPNVYTDTINAVGVDTVNAFLNDMACALNASDERYNSWIAEIINDELAVEEQLDLSKMNMS